MSPSAPGRLSARIGPANSSPVRDILAVTERPEVISFAGGLPAPELLPGEMLRAAIHAACQPARIARSFQYSSSEGLPELRDALASRMRAQGIDAHKDAVLVTTGSQQALGLAAAVLLDPGDAVLVESPSYLAALQCFQLAGARVIPVDCDEQGLDPASLRSLAIQHKPKFVYCIPNFQNPTGRTLSPERRAQIAEVAADQGLWLVEDDPYGDLRYDGTRVTPVAAHPLAADRTIAVSSLSKILAPGLRIGWLHAPPALLRPLMIAKQAADLHTSTVDQIVAAHCLADPAFDHHVELLCDEYRVRRDAMLAGLPLALPEGSRFNRPSGGMFIWVRLPEGHDAARLLPVALEHNVAFVPGQHFYAGQPDPRTMRLSFTTHPATEITEGLRRLGRVF
jgi:2-aminoadipate transaminase